MKQKTFRNRKFMGVMIAAALTSSVVSMPMAASGVKAETVNRKTAQVASFKPALGKSAVKENVKDLQAVVPAPIPTITPPPAKEVVSSETTPIHRKRIKIYAIGNELILSQENIHCTIVKGMYAPIDASVEPYDDSIDPFADFTYISSNPSVATVDSYGVIHAVGNGTCTITVSEGPGVCKDVTITVVTNIRE